jgi:hypothetical protein
MPGFEASGVDHGARDGARAGLHPFASVYDADYYRCSLGPEPYDRSSPAWREQEGRADQRGKSALESLSPHDFAGPGSTCPAGRRCCA